MVRKGIGSDKRIGYSFIFPGVGYGGSCFPKDVKAIIRTASENDVNLRVLQSVEDVNETQKTTLLTRLVDRLGEDLSGRTIAVWGLAFKPNTDDMREAPSLSIIAALQEAGASIRAFDPEGMEEAAKLVEGVTFCDDAYETMQGADCLVLVTEWNEFRNLDLGRIKTLLNQPAMVDLRNVYDPATMREAGIRYCSVGRPDGDAKKKD